MIRTLFILVGATAIAVLLGVSAQTAHAQSTQLTGEQIEKIRSNCTSIKSTLNQLHASDALLRVNRGQVYESMASKLMSPFNSRLSSNRLDSKAPSAVTDTYRSSLDTFRNNYREYEVKLSSAIRINCIDQPEQFHTTIQEARILRSKVHDDVLKLHRNIDDYRTAVGDFQLNYERVSE